MHCTLLTRHRTLVLKVGVPNGWKSVKRKLVHSVVVAISPQNNFTPLLKSFIANLLKCKAHLKVKSTCLSITICSLMMSPFLCDFIKQKYQQCFT